MSLQHLDTVIAFAVLMLGASLIVTAGTQIVISLLGLRGSNLRRSLTDLFETACVDRDAKRYAKQIAHRVLCYPLISDSLFSRLRIPIEEHPFMPPDAAGKLQGAASEFPLRPWLLGALGGFFAWPAALAITRSLSLPDFRQYLNGMGRAVPLLNLCEHPWCSGAVFGAVLGGLFSRWRLATYISVEELVATLEKLSEPAHGTLPTRMQCAMLVISGEAQSEPLSKAKPVAAQVERLVEDAHAQGGVAVAVGKVVAQPPVHAETRLEGLRSWFDHAVDRASQRFMVQARLVAIVLALLFVFAAHLDAIHLFQTLSSDARLRAQLAGTADELTKQADFLRRREGAAFLAAQGGRTTVPDVYREAMSVILQPSPTRAEPARYLLESPNNLQAARAVSSAAKKKNEDAKSASRMNSKNASRGEKPATTSPRREDTETLDAKARAAKALEVMPGFASREDAVSWLRSTLDGNPAADFLVAAYEQELDAELVSDSDTLIDHSASLKRELARSEFQLIPETRSGWTPTSRELPGLLIAAAFLSLGAPFCYNILKRLASFAHSSQ